MPWTQRNWVAYFGRHSAKVNRPWREQIARTKNSTARYKGRVPQQSVETQALPPTGHLIYEQNNLRIYYLEFPFIVGASLGEETNIVRVEWNADPLGSYHGRPMSEDELIDDLKEFNKNELVNYQKRKLENRRTKK